MPSSHNRKAEMPERWEDRYVRVIVEGGHRYFFERFLDAVEVTALTIVSPWISARGILDSQFHGMVKKIRQENIRATVLLRDAIKEPINAEAIALLTDLPTVTVFSNNELHAKLYVCKCSPYGFAYVGSANLTGRGTTAFEVGLVVDGKGEGIPIIDELHRIGWQDLPNRAGSRRITTATSARW